MNNAHEITTRLRGIAAQAELAAIKHEKGRHWEKELRQEVGKIAESVRELVNLVKQSEDDPY